MIIFLLFSFLFLPSNPETQGFASYDGVIENNVQINNSGNNSSQEHDPPNNNDDDDTGKDGIDEDWMFGKTKTIHYLA